MPWTVANHDDFDPEFDALAEGTRFWPSPPCWKAMDRRLGARTWTPLPVPSMPT